MSVDLYYVPLNLMCRSVILVARAVGVKLNLKLVNFRGGGRTKYELLQMNPQNMVPVMNDNGFILIECGAILGYLVDQYAENDYLYPKDPKQRALVNQRLDFNLGTLCPRLHEYYFSISPTEGTANPEKLKEMEEVLKLLDNFLEGKKWVTGSTGETIADIFIKETVGSCLEVGLPVSKYHNVIRWYKRCKRKFNTYDELRSEDLE